MIHYGTLYGPWSHVTMCGMWPWYTMAHYMVNGLMWQCVVYDHDTLWHTTCPCSHVTMWGYVTMIHYGTLYGPWSHVTICGMWPWYTMAHYMVHGLMWQCVVCDRDTLWHTIWSMVSCDNVGGMWPWYTMAHYMSRSIRKPTTWSKFSISAFLHKNYLHTLNNHHLEN